MAAFTYMGTKQRIAGDVAEVIEQARNGPLLDLFAGISTVGLAVAPKRHVWCNDVQYFAHAVATATFTSRSCCDLDAALILLILDLSSYNQTKLKTTHGTRLLAEDEVIALGRHRKVADFNSELVAWCASPNARRVRREFRLKPLGKPYCLFSSTYAGGYLGLRQAIDLDSLRFAIDELKATKEIDAEQHRWMLLALCKALAKIANTTGHFAQYLAIKKETLPRLLAKRRRCVFREWVAAMSELRPAGTPLWRKNNRTFRQDALILLKRLRNSEDRPSVIYADPPYTADHYSRYYHLWETLLRYDYPEPSGKGMYRSDRFVSNFSIRTKVAEEFKTLIAMAAELDVELVINYPTSALLDEPKATLLKLLRNSFTHAEVASEISHQHSTLGASKGVEKEKVTELIFYAH